MTQTSSFDRFVARHGADRCCFEECIYSESLDDGYNTVYPMVVTVSEQQKLFSMPKAQGVVDAQIGDRPYVLIVSDASAWDICSWDEHGASYYRIYLAW